MTKPIDPQAAKILKMSATNAAKALGMWPLNRDVKPWTFANIDHTLFEKFHNGHNAGHSRTKAPSTYLNFARNLCRGTCGYMCQGTDDMTPGPLKQSLLGGYPGIFSVIAMHTPSELLVSNAVTNQVSTISMSLAFKCEKILASNSPISNILYNWKGTEDGTLMQTPPIGQPPHYMKLTNPPSHWNLTMYNKRLKIESHDKSRHGFLNKVLFCAVEVGSISKEPIGDEICCVDKELTPPEAEVVPAFVARLKAW